MVMLANKLGQEELIKGCLAGEENAFLQLVEDNQDMVFSIARRLGTTQQLAEDISQEVFLRVYRNLHSFKGDSKLSTWIYRIAYNTTIEMLRKRKEGFSYEALVEDGWQVEDGGLSPEQEAERNEQAELLGKLISQLPGKYRHVIVLFYLQDKSYEQVAQTTGYPLGTVKTYLHRAKKEMLKAYLRMERGDL